LNQQVSYTYFVSYQYRLRDGIGFGNCEFRIGHEITNINHVRAIEKELQAKNGIKDLAVCNYQLMSKTRGA
jgi:hypothetical protein